MPAIRELICERQTYGYRRITALLNRRNRTADMPLLNHKRIYRLMRSENLLLQKCAGRRIDRAHDGVIRTLRSNTSWCSDGFEIHCWNGEIVRVAFALDTCDREVMTWAASTKGVTGEMIRDMMLIAVEQRFASYRAPQYVEWLSDNGSCYTVTLNPKTGPAGLAKHRQNTSAPSGAFANAKTSYRRTDRSSPSPS